MVDALRVPDWGRAARLTGRFLKRAGELLGAVAVLVVGAGIGIGVALQLRQSDAALLQLAKDVHAAAPSASDERDMLLGVLGVGVFILILGLHMLREWFRPRAAE
jgi:uncharacterized membrane protein